MDVHSSVGGPYNVRGFPTIKVRTLDRKDFGLVDVIVNHVHVITQMLCLSLSNCFHFFYVDFWS